MVVMTLREDISIRAPRAGRGYQAGSILDSFLQISIHAPRAGRGLVGLLTLEKAKISLHAPRAGRGRPYTTGKLMPMAFQSTRPVRGAAA